MCSIVLIHDTKSLKKAKLGHMPREREDKTHNMAGGRMEYSEKLTKYADKCRENKIDGDLFKKHSVFRGLRAPDGSGVLTGLTKISDVIAFDVAGDGTRTPREGLLYYRQYNVRDLIADYETKGRFGFEEVTYLLLFGALPTEEQLKKFRKLLAKNSELPFGFLHDVIIKTPSKDVMNTIGRCVLNLYTYDDMADNIDVENILSQSLGLIAKFPIMAIYAYKAMQHHFDQKSLVIHNPRANLSTAENLLRMLRNNKKYTALEAHVLDIALILHAEHGGGNNSTFTNHVVTSSGTDTYSAVSASIGSLKGPRHGGANIKVVKMFDDLKANVSDTTSDAEVEAYITALLEKRAFDKSGLVYGMGHAVYSLSDPRADILKEYARKLSIEKGLEKDFELYEKVAKMASKLIAEKRKIYKGVAANVDFYSGLIYKMLDIPYELFTPLFAVARITGWCAHRIEEIVSDSKIIRPAYMNVCDKADYTPIEER